MMSMEDTYKNSVLPSRDLVVSTSGSPLLGREPEYTEYRMLSYGNSEIEAETAVDMRNMTVDIEVGSSGASGSQNPLAGAEYQQRGSFSNSVFSDGGLLRQASLRELRSDVQHAASETYLITRLAFILLRLLGVGTRWIGKFLCLGLYALFLMPGFIQVGYYYYFSKCVHRSMVYGDQPRNRFDLYLPPDSHKPRPVVIFVTGGAWIIGYKAWGSLLAQQLVDRNIIVACIDYRNFPQGCVGDMVSDVCTGIGFVCQNIENYGGDPDMIYLAGQSAGAHLAACALMMQAKKQITEEPTDLAWRSSQIKAYFSISGGYNLIKLMDHFHERGLYKSLFLRMMEGAQSLPLYSPEYMVKKPDFMDAVPLLPPITLFHGTADLSIPHEASVEFGDALRLVGARVNVVLYPDKTHTDLFLQDPMRGGRDALMADILAVVHADDEDEKAVDMEISRRRMLPECLLQLARRVSPF